MTKFLIKASIFIALLLAFNFVLGELVRDAIAADTRLARNDADLERCITGKRIVFFGDSHVEHSIDPSILKDVYNFSSAGEPYMMMYYKVLYILKTYPKVDTIVLPFDLHTFSSFRSERLENMWYWKKYVDLAEVSKAKGDIRYLLKLPLSFFPGIDDPHLMSVLLDNQKKHEISAVNCGFSPDGEAQTPEEVFIKLDKRIDQHFKDAELLYPGYTAYFESLLDYAREHDVKVYLLKYPVVDEYREAAKKYIDPTEFDAYEAYILERYPEVTIWNYRSLYQEHLEYFKNQDHLNPVGAKAFSKMLQRNFQKEGI